jgi:hypothetical protein
LSILKMEGVLSCRRRCTCRTAQRHVAAVRASNPTTSTVPLPLPDGFLPVYLFLTCQVASLVSFWLLRFQPIGFLWGPLLDGCLFNNFAATLNTWGRFLRQLPKDEPCSGDKRPTQC